MVKIKRVCENCKYELWPLFEPPCRDCNLHTNDKWEYKEEVWDEDDEDFVPKWMKE